MAVLVAVVAWRWPKCLVSFLHICRGIAAQLGAHEFANRQLASRVKRAVTILIVLVPRINLTESVPISHQGGRPVLEATYPVVTSVCHLRRCDKAPSRR